jgi:hypothetical protein
MVEGAMSVSSRGYGPAMAVGSMRDDWDVEDSLKEELYK